MKKLITSMGVSLLMVILMTAHVSAQNLNQYVRWSNAKMPLKVYIESSTNTKFFKPSFVNSAVAALQEWKQKSSGSFDYKLVKDKSSADIHITWVEALALTEKAHSSEHSWYWGVTNLGNPTTVKIVTKHPLNNSMGNTDLDIYMITLHELGHAVGIWWHTRDAKDVMYKDIHISSVGAGNSKIVKNENAGKLSPRDVSNLKALYSMQGKNVKFIDQTTRLALMENQLYEANTQKFETTGAAGASVGISQGTKRYDINVALVKKIIEKDPNNPEAYNNLGLSYMNSGSYDLAVTALEKAISIKENYDNAHYNLGLVYKAKGNLDKSVFHLNKYLSLNPNSPQKSKVEHVISSMESKLNH